MGNDINSVLHCWFSAREVLQGDLTVQSPFLIELTPPFKLARQADLLKVFSSSIFSDAERLTHIYLSMPTFTWMCFNLTQGLDVLLLGLLYQWNVTDCYTV